jgi:hypothetical protein
MQLTPLQWLLDRKEWDKAMAQATFPQRLPGPRSSRIVSAVSLIGVGLIVGLGLGRFSLAPNVTSTTDLNTVAAPQAISPASSLAAWLNYRAGEREDVVAPQAIAPTSSLVAWLNYRAGERGDVVAPQAIAPTSSLVAWLNYRAGERGDTPPTSSNTGH